MQRHQFRLNSWARVKGIIIGMGSFLFTLTAYGNPVLGNVAAGNISIQQTPNTTTINQSGQQAIINWQSFNIGKGQATHFIQPNGGIILNRISPLQGASQIFGVLTATGRIILVNPAGIYFGPSAYVNVGGLIATTLNITDKNFLNHNYQFVKVGSYAGSVINEGQIIAADHGLVALVGAGVENNGLIRANLGHIVLASGDAVTMDFAGNDLINFEINTPTSSPGVDPHGKKLSNGVSNTGSLIANGGQILVTAKAAQGVLDNVINMQGVVQAKSVYKQNGDLIISGDPNGGIVRVASKINVSGKHRHQTGGNVTITGYDIVLLSPTTIDVSGDAGGGNITIGGNAQGAGPLPNANATVMAPNVNLLANAIISGNGGHIVLWSNDLTKAYGNLSAQGGLLGGNGGLIETSSHNYLDVNGLSVNTEAPNGSDGLWLLDPSNVLITTSNTSGGSFNGLDPNLFTPTSDNSILSNTDIQNNLASTDVSISTGSTGNQNGDITVDAPITWNTSNTLSLDAANDIFINDPITGTAGALQLSAANLPSSITTNSAGAINVNNFQLLQGEWVQNNSTLPSFNVNNNFDIATGSTFNNSYNASFERVAGGNGGSSPFVITDPYGLEGIGTLSLSNNYNLNNDLDLSGTSGWNNGAGFAPITPLTQFAILPYVGVFNGLFHTISNLTMNNTAATDFGLFVNTGSPGEIENLGIVNANLTTASTTNSSAGILLGANNGGSGAIINNDYVLGGNIASNEPNTHLGGLIGFNLGPVSNVSSSANVTDTTNSSNSSPYNQIGGLIGLNESSVSNATSSGAVTFSGSSTNDTNVGGLIGENTGTVADSFSTGLVTSPITNDVNAGGLIADGTPSNTTNSFWDTGTSGQPSSAGGGTGISDSQMKSLSTFSNANWNIGTAPSTSTWSIIDNMTYPFLTALTSAVTIQTPISNVAVNLALAGNIIGSGTTSGTNHTFVGLVPANQVILAYNPTDSFTGNTIFSVPASSFATQNLLSNELLLNSSSLTLSNTLLAHTIDNLSSSGIDYSASGTDLFITPNINFIDNTPYLLDGNITTFGTSALTLNGPLTVGTSLTAGTNGVTLNGNNIAINNTVSGNNPITVSGNNDENTFTLNTDNPQNWLITGTDSGDITGLSGFTGIFNFTDMQNLIGGNAGNDFLFNDQATLSGSINGGSLSEINTLNYSAYSTPINVILKHSIFNGDTFSNNVDITSFTNINNLIADNGNDNLLSLPDKKNTLVITGPLQGFVDDPLQFTGFNFFKSMSGDDTLTFNASPFTFDSNSGLANVEGSNMTFENFQNGTQQTNNSTTNTSAGTTQPLQTSPNPFVSSVIQQGMGTYVAPSPLSFYNSDVSQNIDDMMKYVKKLDDLSKVKINPHCAK